MNPLMQSMGGGMMGGMGGPMGGNNFAQIANIVRMLKSGNPEQIAQSLMQQNPQFKAFVEANKGKSPEQVARENGVDFNQIMGMMR